MFPLAIAIKKISADRAALSCRRADGSTTWSRVQPFFPFHDLDHFAVESTLDLRQGFFGLIAAGWDLEDFTKPGVAARLPREAHQTEVIVGTLEGLARDASHADFAASLAAAFRGQGLPPDYQVGVEALAEVQRIRTALHARWHALAPGETLTLEFAPR